MSQKYKIYLEHNWKILDKIKDWLNFYFDEKEILKVMWISKKRLDLYLFRNKEIKTIKHEKKKLISVDVLEYLGKMIRKN